MKNPYLKNLNKIEFVVTDACTGRCKHCSEGDHALKGRSIDPMVAARAVRKIAEKYEIQTVMTFGGEPLLCAETVCTIHSAAREIQIPKRQVITNGFFSKEPARIREVAEWLADCGVNDLRLSVDAFHQETIPLAVVLQFAEEAKKAGLCVKLQPAWLVGREADNPYNRKTREVLAAFAGLALPEDAGNVIFPQGNAKKYLAEYFGEEAPKNPYEEDPFDLRCISFSADGAVLDGNVYERDIAEIMKEYKPRG